MENTRLLSMIEAASRHLLSEQDRDPYSPTYGCFDRRYWGWKLVDYPEATFQRNVYPLAWWLKRNSGQLEKVELLSGTVKAGLQFAARVQHKDGSFDQAFPQEHSFGATAFLLYPLLEAYQVVRDQCPVFLQESVEDSLRRAAGFLCRHDETHGLISNHLAGAVLSLLVSADLFHEPRYEQRALDLLDRILAQQSPEGWFMEYEGADPGYQTLCLYYLAQVHQVRPNLAIKDALEKAVNFLAWFVHPDGTFAGEYGSRRTAVYYPGGIALLRREIPLAESITQFMLDAILADCTVTLGDVDMGNMAPLLSNYVLALDALQDKKISASPLPWQQDEPCCDFKEAGLYIRGSRRYYAIFGASNGGVLKIFDRKKRSLIWDDGGYVGRLKNGDLITTQMTDLCHPCQVSAGEIRVETPFYAMPHSVPKPPQFILLRLLNLTLMRSIGLGNWLKGILVGLLISGKRPVPLSLMRTLKFDQDQVTVIDKIQLKGRLGLCQLEFGRPFVAIHMASAKYFERFLAMAKPDQAHSLVIESLRMNGTIESQVTV